MGNNLVLSLTALAALVPASVLPYRRAGAEPDLVFWAVLGAAIAGPVAFSSVQLMGAWHTGLGIALWVSVATSVVLFAILAAATRNAWRLTPLLLPYLFLLALLAIVWGRVPERGDVTAAPDGWLVVHIAVSLATYALATLAAVAGTAVLLQERALKGKHPTALTRRLPSIADAESLQLKLLVTAEVVLGAGIVTGMGLKYESVGRLLDFDHKTLLALLAFAVIGGLLWVHQRTGLRGRRAARIVLLAYLLLTLAYPGVKFVTDVLIG